MGESAMNYRACNTRMVMSVALAVAVTLTGCAAIQRSEARSTEQLLAAAGFVMRPADTAERQQHPAGLPPYRLRRRPHGGKGWDTYPGSGGCPRPFTGGWSGESGVSNVR